TRQSANCLTVPNCPPTHRSIAAEGTPRSSLKIKRNSTKPIESSRSAKRSSGAAGRSPFTPRFCRTCSTRLSRRARTSCTATGLLSRLRIGEGKETVGHQPAVATAGTHAVQERARQAQPNRYLLAHAPNGFVQYTNLPLQVGSRG